MDSKELSKILVDLIDRQRGKNESGLEMVASVKTFEEGNIKLYNDGFVIEISDENGKKSEYQLSIVKTK